MPFLPDPKRQIERVCGRDLMWTSRTNLPPLNFVARDQPFGKRHFATYGPKTFEEMERLGIEERSVAGSRPFDDITTAI